MKKTGLDKAATGGAIVKLRGMAGAESVSKDGKTEESYLNHVKDEQSKYDTENERALTKQRKGQIRQWRAGEDVVNAKSFLKIMNRNGVRLTEIGRASSRERV